MKLNVIIPLIVFIFLFVLITTIIISIWIGIISVCCLGLFLIWKWRKTK
jgi:hypothetical protein